MKEELNSINEEIKKLNIVSDSSSLELNGNGYFCFSCEKYEMFLSYNELVYECMNCGHWEYSSS